MVNALIELIETKNEKLKEEAKKYEDKLQVWALKSLILRSQKAVQRPRLEPYIQTKNFEILKMSNLQLMSVEITYFRFAKIYHMIQVIGKKIMEQTFLIFLQKFF